MATAQVIYPRTPSTYHRIVSPTLKLPVEDLTTTSSTPVGLLACQRDPLLRDLETTVVSCSLHQPSPPPVGKKTKKAVLAPELPTGPILEIITFDTVLFPEGGGQPTDIGTITVGSETYQVLQVKRHGGHAVHYVQIPSAKVGSVENAERVFAPGTKVKLSLGREGFDRRYDHMSMHTSQHLLSALLETRLNIPTLSWSLTSYPTPCYVELPRSMTAEEISGIQEEANRLVFEGRQVHVEVQELERSTDQEVEQLKTEAGRAIGKALPSDYTGGVKRVIVIDGVDRNPCCGTHLPSLHNLQLFLLPHTEAVSRSAVTSTRLSFLAGPRLIAHLTSSHSLLTSTASTLSCGPPQVPERVNQVVDDRKRAEKRVLDIEDELAKAIAAQLVREALTFEKVDASSETFVRHVHRTDDSTTTLAFLSAILSGFAEGMEGKGKKFLIVMSSSPSSQSASSQSVVVLTGSEDKQVKAAGDGLKTKIGVRGGGKGSKWSGKFAGVWKEAKQDAVIMEVLKNAVA